MLIQKKTPNDVILLANDKMQHIDSQWFTPHYWQEKGAVVSEKKGRASTYFIDLGEQIGVLRHYWRGGLVGKLLTDQYLYTGLKKTRTYQEFKLLMDLQALNLPVCTPISAMIQRSGIIYRGDLITAAIPGAYSLLDKLKASTLSDAQWQTVASTLAKFHNAGVFHADLNINNILFDEHGDVFLIDFDRGAIKTPSKEISVNNMERLHRSFNKELKRNPVFHWQQSDWHTLHDYYQAELTL